jgi:hypothetical protein
MQSSETVLVFGIHISILRNKILNQLNTIFLYICFVLKRKILHFLTLIINNHSLCTFWSFELISSCFLLWLSSKCKGVRFDSSKVFTSKRKKIMIRLSLKSYIYIYIYILKIYLFFLPNLKSSIKILHTS